MNAFYEKWLADWALVDWAEQEAQFSKWLPIAEGYANLKPIGTIPADLGNLFTGREEALSRIGTALREKGCAALAAVDGLGGMGKTTLAVRFVKNQLSSYCYVLWMSVDPGPQTGKSEAERKAAAMAVRRDLSAAR